MFTIKTRFHDVTLPFCYFLWRFSDHLRNHILGLFV